MKRIVLKEQSLMVMRLRNLVLKDAAPMLEWMHDSELVKNLQADFSVKTIEDCCRFIEESEQNETDIHYAIVNEQDEYMGTVSLKHINQNCKSAEFAIAIRRCAMGKGYAKWGMNEILQKGFKELHLHTIYWCVGKNNNRAVRFYVKNGYFEVSPDKIDAITGYTREQINKYAWF